jgi:hypothetical protein
MTNTRAQGRTPADGSEPTCMPPLARSRYGQLRMRSRRDPRCYLEAGAPTLCRLTGQAGGRGTEAT